jgi:hypothetical protein
LVCLALVAPVMAADVQKLNIKMYCKTCLILTSKIEVMICFVTQSKEQPCYTPSQRTLSIVKSFYWGHLLWSASPWWHQ